MENKIKKIAKIFNRNKYILGNMNWKATKNQINLNWYARNIGNSECINENLGDYLSVPIYEYMLKRFCLDRNIILKKTVHLYCVGSIINMGYQDAVIWGSGLMSQEQVGKKWLSKYYRKLDIRCVRGPETARRLSENGYDVSKCVYGDPAVLMPLIYTPNNKKEKRKYSVIIHKDFDSEVISDNKINIITSDWKQTIDEIYNSELIISSSLHGIILAEAYGIPAIMLNKIVEKDIFKYNDYYYSTGRMEYIRADTVEEALKIPVPDVPDLSNMQNDLIKSFPVDLWRNNEIN